jgi:hypothetical protein
VNSPDIFALDRQIRNGNYPELAFGAGVLARIAFLCILDPA